MRDGMVDYVTLKVNTTSNNIEEIFEFFILVFLQLLYFLDVDDKEEEVHKDQEPFESMEVQNLRFYWRYLSREIHL